MKKRALRHLLDLLAIEGPTGRESEVAACIKEKLIQAGCKKSWIKHDDAHQRLQLSLIHI